MRSDGQSELTASSGPNMTAARADRAEEALVERPRRQRQQGARSAIGWQQRGLEPAQQHEHARCVRGSGQKRSRNQSKPNARSGTTITTAERQHAADRRWAAAAAVAVAAREAR